METGGGSTDKGTKRKIRDENEDGGRKIKQSKNLIKVGTWKLRGTNEVGKLKQLNEVAKKYGVDTVALQEMKQREEIGDYIILSSECEQKIFGMGFMGTHHGGIEKVKEAVTVVLNGLTSEDYQGCCELWEQRCNRCVELMGDYCEGR
ncbi:hypothetical protein ILUMI_20700 [Ignelater luminosus]|uniref:Uncharacterized protein n=1 Tax=Ignelater luminosus TaxID=2038154 RepID=A0A8K0CK82_IGNLU|nr:hypothetical protein ILUMI_20700 [Ignelater luminosus]